MITTAYHHHPSSRGHTRRPIPTLETASTEKEARRVLAWQQDVARSVSLDDSSSQTPTQTSYSPPPFQRADSYPSPRSYHQSHHQSQSQSPSHAHGGSVSGSGGKVVHRETITTESYRRRHSGDAERGSGGGGMSSKAIIESPERVQAAPSPISLPHAHTFSARSVAPVGSVYSYGATRQHRDVLERVPAGTWVGERDRDARPRYVAPVRELERIDERSYVSRGSRQRARSEVGSRYERPLAILPAPTPRNRSPVSHVSHRSTGERKSHHSSRHSRSLERESSYHTARSAHTHHTGTTIKPAVPVPPAPVSYVSKTSSKHGLTTVRVSPKEEDRRSKVSVRPSQVELPRSVVGGRGYAASVAPSDSVSSVGSKRERERLISRMRERERPSERW